jgi:hypothetical protein
MTKKFVVYASYVNYVKTEIEAENIDEAKDMAYDMDGGDFNQYGDGDWNIDNIVEVAK